MSKNLPTLFKRAKSGDIQFWQVKATDDIISKTSGKLGTDKPINHKEVCKGKNIGKKNETTPAQQAISQAESDWKRKKDEGYKSLEDLNLSEEAQMIIGMDKDGLRAILDEKLPQFNTDASGNIKPMLAVTKPWKKGDKKNKYPRLMEPKLDGVRCTITVDGTDVTILSRSGKPYETMTHIRNAIVRGIAKGAFRKFPNPVVLDGELYLHGLLLEEINEAVKKESENTHKIQFWMYDVASLPDKQEDRTSAMLNLASEIHEPDQICYTLHVIVNSDDEVLHYHDQWSEKGFEGGMLKDPEGVYQQGQRSSFWNKVKMFEDTEFAFKNWELGQREEDLIAVCWVDVKGEMQEFRAKMKGSAEMKAKLYKRDDLEGMSLTVKHFGYSKYGIPNLPVGKAFRLLKDL